MKKMFKTGFGILALLLVMVNLTAWFSQDRMLGTTYASQCLAANRLRGPRVGRPSEHGHYPRLARCQRVRVVAVKRENRLYVISRHRVVYIVNARVNLVPMTARLNGARGTVIFNRNDRVRQAGINWLSLSQAGTFIESPVYVNNHRVRGNWLHTRYHCTNTIDVSKPDAHWLQGLPQATQLVIK